MRHSRWFRAAVLFTLAGVGCVAAAADEAGGERPPPPVVVGPALPIPAPSPAPTSPKGPRVRLPPHDLLAWTADRRIATVDGATGAVRQAVVPADFAGDRDLVYDRFHRRVVVVECDDEGPMGEVADYPVSEGSGGPALGARRHLAWVQGDARLLPTPAGTVVFGDGGGDRWILCSGSGVASPAVPAPRPMSAWLTTTAPGPTVHALAYGPSSGELDLVLAPLPGGSPAAPSVGALAVSSGTIPPGARLVPAPARGGALLVDIVGSAVTVRGAGDTGVGPAAQASLGAPGLRIEAAVALEGGAEVALLLSGVTEVVVLAVDPSLTIVSTATVALPGQPAPSTRFLSHDLAAQGPGRIAVATDAGVFSLQVWTDLGGAHAALDPAFQGADLRGPVDAIWDEPH